MFTKILNAKLLDEAVEVLVLYLDGFIIPEASFSIVSFVLSANLIPKQLNAVSAILRVAFSSVGRDLSPMKQSASTVNFLNLTSTVGRLIPTL